MSSITEQELSILAVCVIKKKQLILQKINENKINKKKWSKNWLLKRQQFSHVNLISELSGKPDDFRNYLRMDEETYSLLLSLVSNTIQKQNTVMRKCISPHERLTATLRFLATGRSYTDLQYSTIISKPALSKIIPETCDAIYSALKDTYLKVRYIINS